MNSKKASIELTNKICNQDSDCGETEVCAFDEKDKKHYCVSADPKSLYYGCLVEDAAPFEHVDSNSYNDTLEFHNCINFSRRQKSDNDAFTKYMIFTPEKNVFVDTTNITIYLKCGETILAVIPWADYFDIECDKQQKDCILIARLQQLYSFCYLNSTNCKKDVHLEVIYQCENEAIKNKYIIPIDFESKPKIEINLTCPVNKNKKNAKCSAVYYYQDQNGNTTYDFEKNVDKKKQLYECSKPIYKIPRLVDMDEYKKNEERKLENELGQVEMNIMDEMEKIYQLKAEKLVKLKKMNGENLPFEKAYQIAKSEHLFKNDSSKDAWQMFENMDAVYPVLKKYINEPSAPANKQVQFFGKVYSIEEAIMQANRYNEVFFVWYHNDYPIDSFASKLFFVNKAETNHDLDMNDKTNWVVHDKVTTAFLKMEQYINDFSGLGDTAVLTTDNMEKLREAYVKTINDTLEDKYTLSTTVNRNLDNRITTINQMTSMRMYEDKVNTYILTTLAIILFFMLITCIVLIVYYEQIAGGKISYIGK